MREHDCEIDCAVIGGPPATFCRQTLIGPGPDGCCSGPRVEGPMAEAIRTGKPLQWPEGWPEPCEPSELPATVLGPRRSPKREKADILIF